MSGLKGTIMFIIFIFAYLVLYGTMNLYFFLKAKSAFGPVAKYIALFTIFMILAPILVHLTEKGGFHLSGKILTYVGYTWMGFLLLFCCIAILLDIYHFIVYTMVIISNNSRLYLVLSPKISFLIPCIISVCISVYGYYEAKNIGVERMTITTPKIPEKIGRIKIAQISDLHLGLMVGKERLKNIVKLIKENNPDIIFLTGDLVDAVTNNIEECAPLLRKLNPKYGKYAVTGNHEYFAGIDASVGFIKAAGFTLLRGESVGVDNIFNVVGVDDTAGHMYNLPNNIPEQKLLSDLPSGRYNVLLKHRPDVDKESVSLFDLQLSGHTHKGQIFPFNLIIRLFYSRYAGLWELSAGHYLYISRGTGTWGPSMRFLAPPEIAIIELVSGNGK